MNLIPHMQPTGMAHPGEPSVALLWADVQGAGAEQIAYAAAARNQQLALLQAPVTNGNLTGHASRIDRADRASMQTIATPLRITELAPPTPVANTALAHLPGRVLPTVWDGEPGATDPVHGTY